MACGPRKGNTMTREEMLQAVGRGYTHEGHTHKLVDVDLCVAMVEELLAAQAQATADSSAMGPLTLFEDGEDV